jgi:TRAP-type C4-dicarboxylate transport system substrate-binding protein
LKGQDALSARFQHHNPKSPINGRGPQENAHEELDITPYPHRRRPCDAGHPHVPPGASAATNLTLGHNAAPGNPRSIATERFAEMVKERSGGNISVRVAGSEQLGNEQSLLTSLRTGAVSMTVNSQGSTSALVPEIAALGLPFLFEDSAAAFRVLEGPIGEELAQRFAKVQMVPLGWWDNGIRHITNSKRPITTPADLKGLKIRTRRTR